MPIEVKIPELPESVADALIASWHKKPGDNVVQDENLVDIETDKVLLEVPAPESGVLKEIREAEGATVVAGQVIAILEAGAAAPVAEPPDETVTTQTVDAPALSPAVRKLVAENRIDVTALEGSGKGGRIVKEDVMAYLKQRPGVEKVVAEPEPRAEAPATPPGERVEKRVTMTRLRARIAERLLEAQHNAAILTTFNEVNMAPVMRLRAQYKDRFEKRHGVRLGFMSFFVKAAVEALKRFPEVNASIDGDDIVYHGYYDVGVAVSSPRGLVVPIVRDAEGLSMAQIEQQIGDYGRRAQEGSLGMDDLTGGTFTISNGGVFGSLLSTPILNPPQSAILGMHKIEERAVVHEGEIVIRPMMYLALSYDHRIIDCSGAVRFLVTVKEMLEEPSRILLEV